MMTLSDWRSNPQLADELKKSLQSPVVVAALEIIAGLTMASTMNSHSLLRVEEAGKTLFGYDVGRHSVIQDLRSLSENPKAVEELKPSYEDDNVRYTADREELLKDVVRLHPKKSRKKN